MRRVNQKRKPHRSFEKCELRLLLTGGDFNSDGAVDLHDIDSLTQEIREAGHNFAFDLDGNGVVGESDRNLWITASKSTRFGDANLDRAFDSSDLVEVFKAGEYEDNVDNNSTWQTGDWNGDREFDSGDLVAAFQDGGYERGPRDVYTIEIARDAEVQWTLDSLATSVFLYYDENTNGKLESDELIDDWDDKPLDGELQLTGVSPLAAASRPYYLVVLSGTNTAMPSSPLTISTSIAHNSGDDPGGYELESDPARALQTFTTEEPLIGVIGGPDAADAFAFTLASDSYVELSIDISEEELSAAIYNDKDGDGFLERDRTAFRPEDETIEEWPVFGAHLETSFYLPASAEPYYLVFERIASDGRPAYDINGKYSFSAVTSSVAGAGDDPGGYDIGTTPARSLETLTIVQNQTGVIGGPDAADAFSFMISIDSIVELSIDVDGSSPRVAIYYDENGDGILYRDRPNGLNDETVYDWRVFGESRIFTLPASDEPYYLVYETRTSNIISLPAFWLNTKYTFSISATPGG